jgi:hypothetical protein
MDCDVVNNQVSGAKISTGLGDDVVNNEAYSAEINTGGGNDKVKSMMALTVF